VATKRFILSFERTPKIAMGVRLFFDISKRRAGALGTPALRSVKK
jgi:hypothetical protein